MFSHFVSHFVVSTDNIGVTLHILKEWTDMFLKMWTQLAYFSEVFPHLTAQTGVLP